MSISLTQLFHLQFLQYLSWLTGKKNQVGETYKKAQKANTSDAATHIFKESEALWIWFLVELSMHSSNERPEQLWALMTLKKAKVVSEDRSWFLDMLEHCGALHNSLAGAKKRAGVRAENQPQEPALLGLKNSFFSTCHFYLLFVFQIFLTLNLTGSDSLLPERSHVPDPLLILFHEILGFQMHLSCLVCTSFSTKDYGHV